MQRGELLGLGAGQVLVPGCGRAGCTCDDTENSPLITADLFVVTFWESVAKPQEHLLCVSVS